ncbi:hypothetical protein HXX76_007222 [Chlamydomonas incerta]|uniref:Secretory carrier-associated membrane protein n=1 Tax=Chlamydomonas incerta TaxID=51695 RepID=A0A835T161_CHLIN|nr:hypothetical protein HXX76_007222 [Chlamydomonas incerta]|eukprot:KAG2435137.1 hypothetical protein HXX76_007222 [Chlamydomonas incerta]
MAYGGWGAVGGGAWGGGPGKPEEEEQETPRQAPTSNNVAFGANAYSAPPAQSSSQPDLATTSQRSQGQAGGNTAFGSSAGAYGQAAAAPPSPYGGAPSTSFGASATTDPALRRKEAELAAKEKQLKELEAKLTAAGATIKKKNWPICYPILYHDIAEEIPAQARRIVREGYMTWYGLCICLLWNWFCTCVMLGTNANQKVPSWFLGLLYMLLGIPLSWWLWYKRLYNGAKVDSALGFVWFFVWFAVHTAFCIWAAIAVPFSANQWSFAGFVTAMNALDKGNFPGIVYLVGAGCWSCEAAWSCWVIMDVFLHFRGKGGVKEAKEQAKKEAAMSVLRGQMSNQV